MTFHDVQSLKDHVSSFLNLSGNQAVLDLGCGRGADLIALGAKASNSHRFVGIDSSPESLDAANAKISGDPRFSFVHHDLTQPLPFQDGSFDSVLSTNTLECISDKQALLSEVHRVLRPQGTVVFAHFDWDTQVFNGDDKNLVRRMVQTFGDWQQAWMTDSDAWMGRRLWPTFQQSGLFAGQMHSATLVETTFQAGNYGFGQAEAFGALARRGMIEPTEYRKFVADLSGLAERDSYLFAITLFIYSGKRA